jgi:Cap4 SAVED domain
MNSAEVVKALKAGGVSAEIADALEALARNRGSGVEPFLLSVEGPVELEETRTKCRCHFVAFNGNRQPMIKELVAWLVAQTVDYCIPRSRIAEAVAAQVRTGSTEALKRLAVEADGLFTKLKTSGEGGEMLLYLLLERSLGLPQLLCKMALKSDENMHFHGSDGVHGQVQADGTLALYWGESKLYAKANSAIDACIDGLAPFLKDPGGVEAKRDIYLLRDHLDLGSKEVTDAIKSYFQEGTPERTKVEVRGAALVGSSLAEYSYPLEDDRKTATAEAAALVQAWRERTSLSIDRNELAAFELEIFFVPFPDVQAFRDELRAGLRLT